MFRVGIIGSDNSHALAFSKLVNIKNQQSGEYEYPDFRITGIFGLDRTRTEEVASQGQIEFIADKVEDLYGKVDAVMVVFRHGDLHAQYALPFIKAGIPTWIDKPFTIKVEDAKQLVEAAEKNNTLLTGGSTCKYAYDVVMLQNCVENKRMGEIVSATLNFPADLESEYGGLFFYGPHLVEIVMTIFGYDVKSVVTSVSNNGITAIVKYEGFQVILNFTKGCPQYFGIIYGTKKVIVREIDISIIYKLGFEQFVQMLRTGKRPLSLDKLVMPIIMLNAIVESINTGKEVFLNKF